MSLTIGLTYDLRDDYVSQGFTEEAVAEFDSGETIDALERTIGELGFQTDRIGHARKLCERLVAGGRWDLVFNVAEGVSGRCRESQVPCILDLYGIAYTFSDPLVCAATLDKSVAKRLLRNAGLATPDFRVVRDMADLKTVDMTYPLFAKPLAEGTGKGIDGQSRIDTSDQLATVCRELLTRFAEPVLIEEFLPGREFTVGILGNGSKARVIGTMAIEMLEGPKDGIYSYDFKERCEELIRYSTLQPGPLRKDVEDLALKSYLTLECRDAARVDIRCDKNGRPSFMEINPLPGLHPTHSDLPMIATRAGMSYAELIDQIIKSALARLEVCDDAYV
jgi:D-alanine-D-alanine ligase